MPLHFTIVYFLVTLLYVTYVYGTKSAAASAEIEQLKLNYQHMNARLQNLENENERLHSEITTLQTRASDTTVAFTARLSLDTELSATGTVIFDDVLLNSGNAYNERNGHFTAHVAGTYQLAVSLTNFGKEAHFAVQKNGHDVLSRLYIKSGLTYSSSSVVVAQLDVGDVVQVKGQYFPTNLREGLYSVFSGFLIK